MVVKAVVIRLLSRADISSQQLRVNRREANSRLLSSKLHKAWTVLTMTYRSKV
jgi:hypothetical protein